MNDYIEFGKRFLIKNAITRDNWFKLIPYIMELVENIKEYDSEQKENMVYNICENILVIQLKWLQYDEFKIIRNIIRYCIIPISKCKFSINKKKWCCF